MLARLIAQPDGQWGRTTATRGKHRGTASAASSGWRLVLGLGAVPALIGLVLRTQMLYYGPHLLGPIFSGGHASLGCWPSAATPG
jgi:hypothetical protein